MNKEGQIRMLKERDRTGWLAVRTRSKSEIAEVQHFDPSYTILPKFGQIQIFMTLRVAVLSILFTIFDSQTDHGHC